MRFTQRNVTDADTRTRHTLRTDLPDALSAFPPYTIRLGQLKNKIKQQKSLPGFKIVCLICSGYLRRQTRSSCFVKFPNLVGGRGGGSPNSPPPVPFKPDSHIVFVGSRFFALFRYRSIYFFPEISLSPFFFFLTVYIPSPFPPVPPNIRPLLPSPVKPWPNGVASQGKLGNMTNMNLRTQTCDGWPNGLVSRCKF